jgi:hypothetical protein
MPRTPVQPLKPVSNEDLAVKIDGLRGEVVPRLDRIEGLAEKAGLNGYGADIHEFFEQRADEASAKKWLTRKLKPVARLKVLVAIVGFISTLGWAVLAIRQIVIALPHPH